MTTDTAPTTDGVPEERRPMVTAAKLLVMQVCVPGDWQNDEVQRFANRENPAGTSHGWIVRETTAESAERVPCAERAGFVHICLNC